MPNYSETHDKITAMFYAAKRAGQITPNLQAAFDKIHAENWLQADKDAGKSVDAELALVATTAKVKSDLAAVIGDWTK